MGRLSSTSSLSSGASPSGSQAPSAVRMLHKRSVAFNPWQPTVFDFDSAGTCWRAENRGVCSGPSATYFQAWVAGYRTSRTFGKLDEAAVAVFGIVGDLRVVAWKLGLAESSRGAPRLGIEDLPAIVDGWLDWEVAHLTDRRNQRCLSSLQLRASSNFRARKPAARPHFP